MDWITVIWSAAAGACLILGLTQFVVWCGRKHAWENLWFSVTTVGVIGLIACELLTMKAASAAEYANIVRWAHLIFLIVCGGMLGFVHSHFGTGLRWLLQLAIGLRVAAVIANFTTGANLHFKSVDSLQQIEVLGQSVNIVGTWQANPWVILGQLASLVMLAYIVNAAWRMWHSGTHDARRRAITLGGSLTIFIALAAILAGLVAAGVLKIPLHTSLPFFCMILAMGYELSREVLRSDRLAQQLRTNQLELAHLSRVSVLGEMAGALAHEVNQPLAAILSNAQVGSRSMNKGEPDLVEIHAILDDIANDAKRAGGIIHGMRAMLKKDQPPDPHPLPVNPTIHQVLAMLQGEISSRGVTIELDLEEPLPHTHFNRVELQQVLINLVMNSLDAMKQNPRGAQLKVSTARDGNHVAITIHDSGPGITADIMPQLFDPFFSTKPGGLGLGLPISKSIAEHFGAQLHATNHPHGGAMFELRMQSADALSEKAETPSNPNKP
jgi:signal transduction histidine kinase